MSTRVRMVCTPLFDIPYTGSPRETEGSQRTKAAKGCRDSILRDRHLGAGWMFPLWECPRSLCDPRTGGRPKDANPPRVESAKLHVCHVMQCFGRIDVCKSSSHRAGHLGMNFVRCNPALICWGKNAEGRGVEEGIPPAPQPGTPCQV